jgi:hypothetical protein
LGADSASFPAHHSWGLVFVCQSAAKSHEVLERKRNVAEEVTGQVLPTAMGFAAKQAIAALRKHHVQIAPLLRRAGLSEHDPALAEDDANPTGHRVAAVAQVKFLDYAAEAMNDSAFGLHLAEQTDPRDAGIYFYVASAAKDIDEALALYARYFRIVNEAVRLKVTRKPIGVALEVEFVGLPRHLARQTAEFGMAALLKGLREIAGRNLHPIQASFAHTRSSVGAAIFRLRSRPPRVASPPRSCAPLPPYRRRVRVLL